MGQSIFKVHFVLKLLATVLWLSQQGEFATELCLDADQAAQRLSCNFSGGNFCGWKNSQEDNHDWKGEGSEHIYVDSTNKTTARLESPLVCATGGSLFEIKFRYIFGTSHGGCQLALYLETASERSEVTTLTSHTGWSWSWSWSKGLSWGFSDAGPYHIKCAGEPFKIILEARKSVDTCGPIVGGLKIDDMHIVSVNETTANFTHCRADITQSVTESPFSATRLDLLTPEADSNTSESPSNTTSPASKTPTVQKTSLSNTTSPTSKTSAVQKTLLSNTTSPTTETSTVQTISLSNTTSPTSKTPTVQKTSLSKTTSSTSKTSTVQKTSLANTTSPTYETFTVQTESFSQSSSPTSHPHTLQMKAPPEQTKTPTVPTETPTVLTETPTLQTATPTVQKKTITARTITPTVRVKVPTETPNVQTETPPVQKKTFTAQTKTPTVQTTKTPTVATKPLVVQTKTSIVLTETPTVQTKTPTLRTKTPAASTEIATGQSEALPKTSESTSPSYTASLSKSSTSSLVETEEEGGLSGLTVACIVLAAVAVVVVIGFVVRRVRHRREGLFKRWRSSTGYLITPVDEDGRCRVTYKPARFASLDDDTDDGVSLPLRITDNHYQPV